MAKGKLNRPVFGVVIGLPIDQAIKGPFAQFQNSPDDEDSLTKLVLQLIKRNPEAEPREQTVRRQVTLFRETIVKDIPSAPKTKASPAETEATDAAKLFEEVKLLFRQLTVKLDERAVERSDLRRGRPRVTERIIDAAFGESHDLAVGFLMAVSLFREDAPWIYEAGMEAYRAIQTSLPNRTYHALARFRKVLEFTINSDVTRYLMSDAPNARHALQELQSRTSEFARYLKPPTRAAAPKLRQATLTEQASAADDKK